MKKTIWPLVILCLIVSIELFPSVSSQESLSDLYASGTIQLVPELIIDENSMEGKHFFQAVIEIALDEEGFVYVSDYQANNIKKFDASGVFIKTIGREGQGPGEFSWPWEIAVSRGRLFVWDMRNMRICVLSSDGAFIKAVKIQIQDGRPEKLEALPNGNIVIEMEKIHYQDIDKPQDRTISIYSPTLELKKTFYSQQVWNNKYMNIEGRFTNLPQPFAQLVHWGVSPEGQIAVGFPKAYEIELFNSEGSRLSSFEHRYEPVKVTEEDKKMFFSGISYSTSTSGGAVSRKQGAPDSMVKNTVFPKFKPPFNSVFVDGEGNILVRLHGNERQKENFNFDAFRSDGSFIGNVQIFGEKTFLGQSGTVFEDHFVWMQDRDEDGLISIVKYRISKQ